MCFIAQQTGTVMSRQPDSPSRSTMHMTCSFDNVLLIVAQNPLSLYILCVFLSVFRFWLWWNDLLYIYETERESLQTVQETADDLWGRKGECRMTFCVCGCVGAYVQAFMCACSCVLSLWGCICVCACVHICVNITMDLGFHFSVLFFSAHFLSKLHFLVWVQFDRAVNDCPWTDKGSAAEPKAILDKELPESLLEASDAGRCLSAVGRLAGVRWTYLHWTHRGLHLQCCEEGIFCKHYSQTGERICLLVFCVCVYVCVCVFYRHHVHICSHTHTHACICAHAHTHIYVCVRACVCVCVCVCVICWAMVDGCLISCLGFMTFLFVCFFVFFLLLLLCLD